MTTTAIPSKEGTLPFTYQGEQYETYFKVFGDLENRTRTPVVALHGGPGFSHDYLLPLSDLADRSIPVIFYDQLGNARSSRIHDKPTSFWSIDLFIDELVNVVTYFGIQDSFDLFGHSWGGILATEFELRHKPAGLRYMVVADSLASAELWTKSQKQLIATMPPDVQEGIQAGSKEPEKFYPALAKYHSTYGCRAKPFPPDLRHSLDYNLSPGADRTVARADIVAGWSCIDRLHLVQVSTLLINGRYDMAQDFVVSPFFEKIPRIKWITFESSSHTPFWEERERFTQLLDDFLSL